MDFTSSNKIEITKLALDGLYERQRAIAANTANVNTPNYQRKDVVFEEYVEKIPVENKKIEKQILNKTNNIYKLKKLDEFMRE